MAYKIVTTDDFKRDVKRLAKKYPSLKSDILKLGELLTQNPEQGDSPRKGCFKVRLQIESKGRGKSGGGRVVTNVLVAKEKVYLLALYDKSEVSTLTDDQVSERLRPIEEGNE